MTKQEGIRLGNSIIDYLVRQRYSMFLRKLWGMKK